MKCGLSYPSLGGGGARPRRPPPPPMDPPLISGAFILRDLYTAAIYIYSTWSASGGVFPTCWLGRRRLMSADDIARFSTAESIYVSLCVKHKSVYCSLRRLRGHPELGTRHGGHPELGTRHGGHPELGTRHGGRPELGTRHGGRPSLSFCRVN